MIDIFSNIILLIKMEYTQVLFFSTFIWCR